MPGIPFDNSQSNENRYKFDDTRHAALGAQVRVSAPWTLNFGVAYDIPRSRKNTMVSPSISANAARRFGIGMQNQVRGDFEWDVGVE